MLSNNHQHQDALPSIDPQLPTHRLRLSDTEQWLGAAFTPRGSVGGPLPSVSQQKVIEFGILACGRGSSSESIAARPSCRLTNEANVAGDK